MNGINYSQRCAFKQIRIERKEIKREIALQRLTK